MNLSFPVCISSLLLSCICRKCKFGRICKWRYARLLETNRMSSLSYCRSYTHHLLVPLTYLECLLTFVFFIQIRRGMHHDRGRNVQDCLRRSVGEEVRDGQRHCAADRLQGEPGDIHGDKVRKESREIFSLKPFDQCILSLHQFLRKTCNTLDTWSCFAMFQI